MIASSWQIGLGVVGLIIVVAAIRWLARFDNLGLSILGWVLVAVLIAAGTGAGLMWLLGWPKVPRSSAFTTAETLDLLKIALTVVAGFGGVVLLAVNYRKQRFTEKAHELSEGQESREQTKLLNERFAVAAEQLAHERASVRLAGVYAMAGLADDWPAQRQQCVEVLIAYLRLSRATGHPDGEDEAQVIGTIFRAFRERLRGSWTENSWSSLDFDFTGVTFDEADFGGLRFDGKVTFDGATFTGETTSFAAGRFKGTVSYHGAEFHSDRLDFQRTRFDGGVEFVGTRFGGVKADFSGSWIDGAQVDFYRCVFTDGCELTFRDLDVSAGLLRFDRCTVGETVLDFDSAVVGPWSERRRVRDVLLGRESNRRPAVLAITDCTFENCTVEFEDVYVVNGRMVLTDNAFLHSRLSIRSLQQDHPSLVVRRIDERDSTIDIPVQPRFWRLTSEAQPHRSSGT